MSSKHEKLKHKLVDYINLHYVPEHASYKKIAYIQEAKNTIFRPQHEAHKLIFAVDEPFIEKLYKLIDASGKTDVEIYKKAGIDRRHYAKIKNPTYVPQKKTIVAFIFALELKLPEAEDLLESAGMALSSSYLFDVIVRFYLEEEIYDITLINDTLLEYDQPLIGF